MNINKDSYNKIAEQWNEHRQKSSINPCIVDFAARIKPNGAILDIGCGTGYPIAQYLSQQGFAVTGIDNSRNMINKAIDQHLPNAKFLLCDFFDFTPVEAYDAIIAFDSFFHFPMERQREIYQKVSGWMNTGAYLLFTHGKREDEIKGFMYEEPFYYSALHTRDVHTLLSDSGLTVELSIEDYKETNSERDLLIVAKKLK